MQLDPYYDTIDDFLTTRYGADYRTLPTKKKLELQQRNVELLQDALAIADTDENAKGDISKISFSDMMKLQNRYQKDMPNDLSMFGNPLSDRYNEMRARKEMLAEHDRRQRQARNYRPVDFTPEQYYGAMDMSMGDVGYGQNAIILQRMMEQSKRRNKQQSKLKKTESKKK